MSIIKIKFIGYLWTSALHIILLKLTINRTVAFLFHNSFCCLSLVSSRIVGCMYLAVIEALGGSLCPRTKLERVYIFPFRLRDVRHESIDKTSVHARDRLVHKFSNLRRGSHTLQASFVCACELHPRERPQLRSLAQWVLSPDCRCAVEAEGIRLYRCCQLANSVPRCDFFIMRSVSASFTQLLCSIRCLQKPENR